MLVFLEKALPTNVGKNTNKPFNLQRDLLVPLTCTSVKKSEEMATHEAVKNLHTKALSCPAAA